MNPSGRVTVINATAREMNHLASALVAQGELRRYVRVYANQGRNADQLLATLPALKSVYESTFGRRTTPVGLRGHITVAGVVPDVAFAVAKRFGLAGRRAAMWFNRHIARDIGRVGGRFAVNSPMVVASYFVAKEPFRRSADVKVLNYPSTHHRYMRELCAEEARRDPEFAPSLPDWHLMPTEQERSLDEEVALADRILVGSTFAKDSFVASGVPEGKLIVVPYGVDVTTFTPANTGPQSSDGFRILYVGQIGQRKGLGYLLRAYKRFRAPGTRLTLVGDFYGSAKPFKRYRALFDHIPNVPQSRLGQLYRQSDVFLFPTLVEGMGLVFLEAMASGLPVIVTPNGPGDIVRDGVDGFVVPPRDVDAIVEKLAYLRANPERRREMGENARRRALGFTWDIYGRRAAVAVLSLLDGSRADALAALDMVGLG